MTGTDIHTNTYTDKRWGIRKDIHSPTNLKLLSNKKERSCGHLNIHPAFKNRIQSLKLTYFWNKNNINYLKYTCNKNIFKRERKIFDGASEKEIRKIIQIFSSIDWLDLTIWIQTSKKEKKNTRKNRFFFSVGHTRARRNIQALK